MSAYDRTAPTVQLPSKRPAIPVGVAQPTKRQLDAAAIEAVLATFSVAVVPGRRKYEPQFDVVPGPPYDSHAHTHALYANF